MIYLYAQKAKRNLSGICGAAFILVCVQANAALYTFEFTAITDTIVSNENGILPDLALGQSVSGMFSYEDTPNESEASRGLYRPNQGGISLSIGSTLLQSSNAGTIFMSDNARANFDGILHTASLNSSLWTSGRLMIQLEDHSEQALNSIDLPTQINLNSFGDIQLVRLFGVDRATGSEVRARFRIDSITLVPEPSVTLLFGLASVVSLARRSRKKS